MYFIGIDISKFKHDCAIIDKPVTRLQLPGHLPTTVKVFPYSNSCWMPWMDKRK